jgi:hypothetical protein
MNNYTVRAFCQITLLLDRADPDTIESSNCWVMKNQTRTETRTSRSAHSTNGDTMDSATLEFLATWRRQDGTVRPDEIRSAEIEVKEFKLSMNESRALSGQPPVFPEAVSSDPTSLS